MIDPKHLFLRYAATLIAKLENDLADSSEQPLKQELRERTLRLLETLLQSDDPGEWPATCNLLLQFAPQIEQAGYRGEWLPYLKRALELSKQIGDIEGEASIGLELGILYQLDSQWPQAEVLLQSSATLYQKLGQWNTYANILNRLGYIARNQGELANAEQLVNQALSHLQEDDAERHFSLFVLGVIAADRLDWKVAENFYRQSLEICQQHNDFRNAARRHRDIGVALDGQDNLRTARTCYEQAICMFEQIGDRYEAAVTKMNLGIVYSKLGNSLRALDYYADAENVFRHIQDELQLGYVLFNQGVDYQELQRYSDAEAKFKAAIAIRLRVSSPASVVYAQIILGELYLQTECRLEAIKIFDNASRHLDKIADASVATRYKARIKTSLVQFGERQ